MDSQLLVRPDFHLRSGAAPEWNQQYLQMSPGVMRSMLSEWKGDGVHVFRKWMSERVVQRGGLPPGQLCFALLGNRPHAAVRVQGREFGEDHLLLLRSGQEFEIQRAPGMEFLALTFAGKSFSEYLDESRAPLGVRKALLRPVVRVDPQLLLALRRTIQAQFDDAASRHPGISATWMRAVCEVLADAANATPQRAASTAAASLVRQCEQMASADSGERPPRIEELSVRLGMSRRTLQNSFHRIASTKPVTYLRNVRLNLVRRRLLASATTQLSVSQAATDAGFDHLGHFAREYKNLFGELPSQTPRLAGHCR